jgi:hypothetical protein
MGNNSTTAGAFRKSTYSGGANANCVEVALMADGVRVRDSKDRGGPILRFTFSEWAAFIAGAQAGEFDLS